MLDSYCCVVKPYEEDPKLYNFGIIEFMHGRPQLSGAGDGDRETTG